MKTLFIPTLTFSLIGCSLVPVTEVDTTKYKSLTKMIDSEFSEAAFIQVDSNGLRTLPINNKNTLNRPFRALTDLCLKQEGTLIQKETLYTIPGTEDLTGLFTCKSKDQEKWMVKIGINNPHFSNQYVRVISVKEIDPQEYFYQNMLRLDKIKTAQAKKIIAKYKTEQKTKEDQEFAKKNFEIQKVASKKIGESVCTWGNSFGYIEVISKYRVKVFVKGTVTNKPDGYLFTPDDKTFNYVSLEQYIWADYDKWASCNANVKL